MENWCPYVAYICAVFIVVAENVSAAFNAWAAIAVFNTHLLYLVYNSLLNVWIVLD